MSKDFMDNIEQIVLSNLGIEGFGVSELSHELGLSRSSLSEKLRHPQVNQSTC